MRYAAEQKMIAMEKPAVAREKPDIQKWFDELSAHDRARAIEDRLARGKINGEELVAMLPQLTSFERGELGMFIGATLPSEPYAAAFYRCWDDIPEEGRERLVRHFVNEEPDQVFLVAPFVKQIVTWKVIEKYYMGFPPLVSR